MDNNRNLQRLPSVINKKESVINQLKDAFSSGIMTLDDFESRIARAENTNAIAELDSLINDLPKPDISYEITESENITCNMATKKLTGTILKTRKIDIEASMSTITIDYLEEEPISGIQVINLNTNMTNLILCLPDDVIVENKLSEEVTTFKEYRNKYYNPRNPKTIIKITGMSKMTTIKIKRKKYWFFSKKKSN